MKVVVVGGGWAGSAAAYAAVMAGAEVTLVEKTDMLLGTGLVGGIMRNNGRYTATEEIIALGGRQFIELIDSVVRHKDIDFPGHKHASLYDVTKIGPVINGKLEKMGIDIRFKTLITQVETKQDTSDRITGLVTKAGEKLQGDVFIDSTGSAGPMKNCIKYGQGCAMCILRCPTFGPRVSIVEKAGVKEIVIGPDENDFVAMSGSCKIDKNSLDPFLLKELNEKGVLVIPLPESMYKKNILNRKACQQYALQEYAKNLIFLDTGHAKMMTPFFELEKLRMIKGFEDARYADPYSGGQGNSIRFMTAAPCDDTLKVEGLDNLFCAGEKVGPIVGHTEAIATGMLAGHNAVRKAMDKELLKISDELAIGDIISFMHKEMKTKQGLNRKYTFSGSVYFQRMQEKGLYTCNHHIVERRVKAAGLYEVFSRPLF